MSDSYLIAKKIYLTAFKENYFINSLLYKKKYICKENWYGGKVRKLYSRSTSWLSGYSLRRFRGW